MIASIRKGAGLAALASVVGVLSCREATQIKLIVTTDVGCPQKTDIAPRLNDVIILTGKKLERTGGEVIPNAQTDQCISTASDPTPPVDPPNEIGSLVLLPEGEDPSVEVLVVAGVTVGDGAVEGSTSMGAGACATRVNSDESIEGLPCIVSRRRLTFVDHNGLVLPIVLDARCIGEECGADLTCYQGNCVSPDIECDPDKPECAPPIQCKDDCEATCGSSNAQCIDGKCECLACNVEECGDDCKPPSAPYCDPETDSCSCVVCEDDACDTLCGGDGTCDGALCICDGCFEEGCEALPCEVDGTFQCVGRPPDEVCSCQGSSCDAGSCDQSCDALGGAGLVGQCDDNTCECVCDADQCAADCDGTCDGNQCECLAPCSATACDESLGACSERGQVRVCAPFCACACETIECAADCVSEGHDGGHCNAAAGAEDCICEDDMSTGGGGQGGGGGGGSMNGGAPPNGGAPADGGGSSVGGGPLVGGGGEGGVGGDCCSGVSPSCNAGESEHCFPGDICQCTCDAMECMAVQCPELSGLPTCFGMGPGSCTCRCNPTECAADCGIQGGSCMSATTCQCNGCPSPVPAPDCGMCDSVCMGMGGTGCTSVTCNQDSTPVQCFCM